MTPATYNFEDTVRGDTIKTRDVTILLDGSPASITTARMYIRGKNDSLVYKNDNLTVNTNVVTIPTIAGSETKNFPVDTLQYDLEVTLSGGVVRTYMQGSITILKDYTNV